MGKSSFFLSCLGFSDNFYQISLGTFNKLYLENLCERSIEKLKYLLLKNNPAFGKERKG